MRIKNWYQERLKKEWRQKHIEKRPKDESPIMSFLLLFSIVFSYVLSNTLIINPNTPFWLVFLVMLFLMILLLYSYKYESLYQIIRPNWKTIFIHTTVLVIVYTLLALFLIHIGKATTQTNQTTVVELIKQRPIRMTMFSCLLAPCFEEYLFRQLVPRFFEKTIKISFLYGLVLSGLLFLYLHHPVGFAGMALYGLLTIAFSYTRYTSTFLTSTGVHILWNTLVFIPFLL